jgi:Arc/MetJ-type ribon-helix-helix transcriptional regulator
MEFNELLEKKFSGQGMDYIPKRNGGRPQKLSYKSKTTTINLPETYINYGVELVKLGYYPSRSEFIRHALGLFAKKLEREWEIKGTMRPITANIPTEAKDEIINKFICDPEEDKAGLFPSFSEFCRTATMELINSWDALFEENNKEVLTE